MNALELAEERARNPWMEPECNAEDFEKLAIALRQQQAEIEKLRSWVEMLVEVPFFNAMMEGNKK
jgi:hypothetical protein